MVSDTLASRLGTTVHLSPLLNKAKRAGLCTGEDLERLAVERGCRYYDLRGDSSVVREDSPTPRARQFSNEELAIALLSASLPRSQHRLRLGAAMLSANGSSPAKIARLAKLERSEVVVRHIALSGKKVEPQNAFWDDLLTQFPELVMPLPDVLPHLTRFVAMTGITRGSKETVMHWIRPHSTRS